MTVPPRKRVVLSGWHGHDNAGDDATLRVFIQKYIEGRNRELTVLSELPERVIEEFGSPVVNSVFHHETVGLHGLTHLLKGRLGKHLGLLRSCDGFFMGGGSLLRDNTNWHNLFRVVDEVFWTHWAGGKVALYAAGIGPIQTRLGRKLIQMTARRCDLITVRDEGSRKQLLDLGVKPERILVVADPGFLLGGRPVEDPELMERVRAPGTVGLFPSLGFIEDGDDLSQVPRLAAALDELHEQHALNFLSVPMRVLENEIDDLHVTALIRERMRHPEALGVYEKRLGAEQIKWLTGQFSLNITIRLHALIFSLSNRVPTVAVEYEPKVTNLLRDFRLEDFGAPMGEGLTRSLVERTTRALQNRTAVSAHIGERLPGFEASANRCFEAFEELLGEHDSPSPPEAEPFVSDLEAPQSPAERSSRKRASS